MYRISGKQFIDALCSAVMAGVIVACAQRASMRSARRRANAIADPTVHPKEQTTSRFITRSVRSS